MREKSEKVSENKNIVRVSPAGKVEYLWLVDCSDPLCRIGYILTQIVFKAVVPVFSIFEDLVTG